MKKKNKSATINTSFLLRRTNNIVAWLLFIGVCACLCAVFVCDFSPSSAQVYDQNRLSAEVDQEGVYLYWHFDTDSLIDSFFILRSSTGDPTYSDAEDRKKLASSTTNYVWQVNDGESYYFRACAFDSTTQLCSYSNTVQVTAYGPLELDFTGVTAGEIVSGRQEIGVSANFDASTVEFDITQGSDLVYSTSESSYYAGDRDYSFVWDTDSGGFPDGKYTVNAAGYREGNRVAQHSIDLIVENSPTINIVSPSDGASLSRTAVLEAEASESVGAVEFRIVNSRQSEVLEGERQSGGSLYSAELDTTGLSYDNYDIQAVGYFDNEIVRDSVSVSVLNEVIEETVSNLSVTIGSPDYPLSGVETLEARTNTPAEVSFYVYKSGSRIGSYQAAEQGGGYYTYDWDTIREDDGGYTVEAVAVKRGYSDAKDETEVTIDNETVFEEVEVQREVEITSEFGVVSEPAVKVMAQTNFTPYEISFSVAGPRSAVYPAIAAGAGSYYFDWKLKEKEYPFGQYVITAVASAGGQEYSDKIQIEYSEENFDEEIEEDGSGQDTEDSEEADSTEQEPDAADYTVSFAPEPAEQVSGTVDIGLKSSRELDRAALRISRTDGSIVSSYELNERDPYYYYFNWDTGGVLAGDYNLAIKTYKNGETKQLEHLLEVVKKDGSEENSGSEGGNEDKALPRECREKKINDDDACREFLGLPEDCRNNNIITQKACDRLLEKLSVCSQQDISSIEPCLRYLGLPEECRRAGLKNQQECDEYTALDSYCRDRDLSQEKCNLVMMLPVECREDEIWEPASCREHIFLSQAPELCRQIEADTMSECSDILEERKGLSSRCLKEGIKTLSECRDYTEKQDLPQACRSRSITDKQECVAWIRKVIFGSDSLGELVADCQEEGVGGQEECRDYLYQTYPPDLCREGGVRTVRACARLVYSNYSGDGGLPDKGRLPVCGSPSDFSDAECKRIIRQTYLPQECREQGLTEPADCDRYLRHKFMPEECRDAAFSTMEECDSHLFNKYAVDQCKTAGVSSVEECRDLMFNRYGIKVSCDNRDSWECLEAVEEGYLGMIAAVQGRYEGLRSLARVSATSSLSLGRISDSLQDSKGMLPIRNENARVRAVQSPEKITINRDEELIQTSPVVIVADSDGDGLPDAMEKRIGTDPAKSDSDNDGYSDGEELANGYNPLGGGRLRDEQRPAPAEEAILSNAGLDQPKTSGRTDDLFIIEKVGAKSSGQPADGKEAAGTGYAITGKAVPGAVVTLYIYSDVPLVTTVKTDKYGNWEYDFHDPLNEGRHEAYVALNDNTGKLMAKSRPFEFFVKEARAVSAGEFIAVADSHSRERTDSYLKYYIIMAAVVAVAGILLFVVFLNIYKNSRQLDV